MLGRFFRLGKVRLGFFFPPGKIYTGIHFPGVILSRGDFSEGKFYAGGNSMLQHRESNPDLPIHSPARYLYATAAGNKASN